MKKISVNNLILFRNMTEKTQKTFLKNLEKKSEIKIEGGGNYWIRSLSALSSAVKINSTVPIKEKISEILELFNTKLTNQTKDMYERNLEILHNYEDFDFSAFLPKDFEIISKTSHKSIIYIDTIPIQILPTQIFSFEKDGIHYVGAIWFVAKLNSYNREELGLFSEILFKYLENIFSKKFTVSEESCLIVDVIAKKEVCYKMISDRTIKSILDLTLREIKKLM